MVLAVSDNEPVDGSELLFVAELGWVKLDDSVTLREGVGGGVIVGVRDALNELSFRDRVGGTV